jgi:hypothetical protein
MPDLKVVEGGREEDLVATLIRAIDLAKSSRSHTTLYLLKMALLNEGIRLAADLSRKEAAPAAPKECSPSSRPNFVDAEGILGCQLPSLHSARRVVARPR